MTRLALIVAVGLMAAACAPPDPEIRYVTRVERRPIPAALLVAPELPVKPAPPIRESDVVRYVGAIAEAAQMCIGQLESIGVLHADPDPPH